MREEGCSRNQLHVMMHGKPHGSYMEGELPKAETHKNGKANPNSEGDVSRTRRPSTVMISGKGKKDMCVLCACVCCACVLCLCGVLVCCACVLCLCAVLVWRARVAFLLALLAWLACCACVAGLCVELLYLAIDLRLSRARSC